MEKLEAAQRFACRAITGMPKTSPNDLLLIESNLPSISTRAKQLITTGYDKALRSEDNNPRATACKGNIRQRTKRKDWRNTAKTLHQQIFNEDSGNASKFPPHRKPWETIDNTKFIKAMERKTTSKEDNKNAAQVIIKELTDNHDIAIYTDGSAVEANTNGGAGFVITHKNGAKERHSHPAGRLTSSFQAEMTAIDLALTAIPNTTNSSVLIITDSLSSWARIRSLTRGEHPQDRTEDNILEHLKRHTEQHVKTTFLWSPSHCGIEGNEEADKLADAGSRMDQAGIPWSFKTAKATINRSLRSKSMHRSEHSAVYANHKGETRFPKLNSSSRRTQVLASRVRSNHHPETLYWRHKLGLADVNLCRLCEEEEETAVHIVTRCPAITKFTHNNDILFDEEEIDRRWTKWTNKVAATIQT